MLKSKSPPTKRESQHNFDLLEDAKFHLKKWNAFSYYPLQSSLIIVTRGLFKIRINHSRCWRCRSTNPAFAIVTNAINWIYIISSALVRVLYFISSYPFLETDAKGEGDRKRISNFHINSSLQRVFTLLTATRGYVKTCWKDNDKRTRKSWDLKCAILHIPSGPLGMKKSPSVRLVVQPSFEVGSALHSFVWSRDSLAFGLGLWDERIWMR